MSEDLNTPATKADLMRHANDDARFQSQILEILSKQPTRDDIAKLATKKDVEGAVSAYDAFTKAASFVQKNGKRISVAVYGISTFIIGVSIISGAWKVGLAWFLTHVFSIHSQ